jgi:hypothetical protein
LDVFDYVPGATPEDPEKIFASSIESNGLKYVAKDWLIKMKIDAGRTKDKADLEHLR